MFFSKTNFKKATAILVLNCFLFSISADTLYSAVAQIPIVPATNATAATFQNVFQSKILIPQSYGKITDVCDIKSDTVIVNIQDMHAHGATQRNISKIIELIDNNYKLNGVYAEGGVGSIDISWINQIQDKELREKIINNLVDEGNLTAGEYYYMTSGKESALKGLEDAAIHRDNIIRLADIEIKKDEYQKIAEDINKEIQILNKIYTNSKNVRFNRLLTRYAKGKISESKLYAAISKYAKAINANPERYNNVTKIKLEDYPNIKFYMDMNVLSDKIDNAKATQELQVLIHLLKERIPYNSYQQLLTYTEQFQNIDRLIEVLVNLAEKYNLDLTANFRSLNTLIEINELANKLNPMELIGEQRYLIERIRMALSYDDTEAEITFISDFKDYFKAYITASLSKEDWEYAKGRIDKFVSIYEKYSGSYRINEIKQNFNELNKYYDINTQRDAIFLGNLNISKNAVNPTAQNRLPAEILSNAKEVKIVITGGYHTKGLQEILAGKGISTIVITPTVTGGISAAYEKYTSTIKKQGKVFSQALAALMVSSATPLQQKALLVEAAVRMFGINSPEFASITNALKSMGADVAVQEDKITVSLSGESVEIDLAGKAAIPVHSITENIKDVLAHSREIFNTKNPLENLMGVEYEILKVISSSLFEQGIYFSKGTTREVEQAGYLGRDLDGVKYDVYKYFPSVMQNMLLDKELSKEDNIKPSPFRFMLGSEGGGDGIVPPGGGNNALGGYINWQSWLRSWENWLRSLDIQAWTEIAVKKYTDMLSKSEELTADNPADFILICGNNNVDTFKKALEYYENGAAKKIIISGGFGRLTIPVLEEAIKLGLEVQISETETIRNIEDYKKLIESLKNDKGEIDDNKRKELIKISEARIIEIILRHFAEEGKLKADDLILDTSARFTAENFSNETVKNAIEKHFKETNKPVRFAYIQTPLQQIRTKGTFNGVFADEIEQGEIEGISVTIPYENKNLEQEVEVIAAELLRILIYSAKGDIALLLNEIPENSWLEVAALIENSKNSATIKKFLQGFMQNSMSLFSSEQDFINKLEIAVSNNEQLSAIKQFLNSFSSDKKDNALRGILPKTMEKIVKPMLAAGKPALKIAWKVALAEFLPSLNLFKFVRGHKGEGLGAIIGSLAVSLSGYLTLFASASVLVPLAIALPFAAPVFVIAAVVLSLFFGASVNFGVHTFMDTLYINKLIENDRINSIIKQFEEGSIKQLEGISLADVISHINGDVLNKNAAAYNRKKLKDYVERQFPDKAKGITELISNAIDASKSQVSVSFGQDNVIIENDGEQGISLETVIKNLINTANSTKTDKAKQIGRFGLGFFSALNLLNSEEDSLEIISIRDNNSFKFVIGVRYNNDGSRDFYVKEITPFSKDLAQANGTQIKIYYSQKLDRQHFLNTVKQDFAYSPVKVDLYDDGKPIQFQTNISDFENISKNNNEELNIYSKNRLVKTPGQGKLAVVVKGVTFFEMEVLGANAQESLIVTLPNDLDFSISRDSITINKKLVVYVKILIDDIVKSDKSFAEKMSILNSLYVMCEHFEMQKSGFIQKTKIRRAASKLINEEKEVSFIVADSIENYEFFGIGNKAAVLVNPNLLKKEILPKPTGSNSKLLTVKFDNETVFETGSEYNKKYLIKIGDVIVVNRLNDSGVFENTDIYVAFMKAIEKEINKSHERVLVDKSAKFYTRKGTKHSKEFSSMRNISSSENNESYRLVSELMQEVFGIDNKNQLTNEISQTVHDLSQSEGVFIREFLKNAVEAKAKSLDIELNKENGVLKITDNGIGMDLKQITEKLLIPQATDKKGINNFGTGIFSAFNENIEKLVITTSKGGKKYVVELFPVVEDGRVTDIQYSISETKSDSKASGTTVEFYHNGKDMKYLSRNLYKNLEALNLNEINVNVDGKRFSQEKEKINNPVGLETSEISLYYSKKRQSFISVGGFFVKDINVDFLVRELGVKQNTKLFEMLKYLVEHGIIIDLPSSVKLLLNKQDFIIDDDTKEVIVKHLTDAFVKLYMRTAGNNETIIKEIPYDYLHKFSAINKIMDFHMVDEGLHLIAIRWVLTSLNDIFIDAIIPQSIIASSEASIMEACKFIYSVIPNFDPNGVKAESLYKEIINANGNVEDLMWIMKNVRKEIMYEAINYLLKGNQTLINDYNLRKMADVIMTENDIDYSKKGSPLIVNSLLYYDGDISKEVTRIEKIIMDVQKEESSSTSATIDTNDVKDIKDLNGVLSNAKEKLSKYPDSKIKYAQGTSSELDLMHKISQTIINAIVAACFGENSGINIKIDFDCDLSRNAAAWAGGDTITINMADDSWYHVLFGMRIDTSTMSAEDAAFFDTFRGSESDKVDIHKFISSKGGTLFHEITHLIEDESNGTHNKAFYDLERHIMAQFINNEQALASVFAMVYMQFSTEQFSDYSSTITKVWGEEKAKAVEDKRLSLFAQSEEDATSTEDVPALNDNVKAEYDANILNSNFVNFDQINTFVNALQPSYAYSDKVVLNLNSESMIYNLPAPRLLALKASKDATMSAIKNFSAILPENKKMLADVKSPLSSAIRIAFKEFFKSLNPVKFTKAHAREGQSFKEAVKDNAAPLVVSLSGWTAFGLFLSAALLFAPLAVPLAAAFSAFIGSAANIVTHIIIDYKYLKSSDLAEVVKQHGQAKTVNLKNYTVYVVNDMIEGEVTGINIDGVPVRISRINNSIVVSANGIEHSRIVKAINNTKALKVALSDATGVKADELEINSIAVDNDAQSGVRFEDGIITVGYKDLFNYTSQSTERFGKYAGALSKIEREHRNAIIDKFIYFLNGNAKEALNELLQQQDTTNIKLAISIERYNELKDSIKDAKTKGIEVFLLTEQNIQAENFEFADGLIVSGQLRYTDTSKENDKVLLVENIDANFNRKVLEFDGVVLMDVAAIKEHSQSRDNLEVNGLFSVMSGIVSALGEYTIGDISLRDIKKMLPALVENIEIKDETLKERIKESVYNKNIADFIETMEDTGESEAVIIYLKDASVSTDKKIAVIEYLNHLLFTSNVEIKSNVLLARSTQTYRSILAAA
jgi:hypothetical protein